MAGDRLNGEEEKRKDNAETQRTCRKCGGRSYRAGAERERVVRLRKPTLQQRQELVC